MFRPDVPLIIPAAGCFPQILREELQDCSLLAAADIRRKNQWVTTLQDLYEKSLKIPENERHQLDSQLGKQRIFLKK